MTITFVLFAEEGQPVCAALETAVAADDVQSPSLDPLMDEIFFDYGESEAAAPRDTPYSNFNFQVEFSGVAHDGTNNAAVPDESFSLG